MKLMLVSLTALFSLACALPNSVASMLRDKDLAKYPPGSCVTLSEAGTLTGVYSILISAYDPTVAERYLSDDFVEYSDSINSFEGIPLGAPTFPTKQAFMTAVAAQPPFPLEITGVSALGCQSVVLTWQGSFGVARQSVRGLVALIFGKTGKRKEWQIRRIDMEMNSLMYLVNIGGDFTLPKKP